MPPSGTRRAAIAAIGAGIVAAALPSHSAPATGTRRLGVFYFHDPNSSVPFEAYPATLKELAKLGWVEGRNLVVVQRYATHPDNIAERSTELVRAGVDAIYTEGTAQTRAVQQATKTIPIVTGVSDPVGRGFARSLVRPGGNITGLSFAMDDIARQQLNLLHAMAPKLALLTVPMDWENPSSRELARPMLAAAADAGIPSEYMSIASLADVQSAFRVQGGAGMRAVFLVSPFTDFIELKPMTQLAIRNRVPTMANFAEFVAAGGLMSFMLIHENPAQRTAALIDKVFRGIDPAGIPFELPTKSDLAINRTTAAALKLAIPPDLLLRADRVLD